MKDHHKMLVWYCKGMYQWEPGSARAYPIDDNSCGTEKISDMSKAKWRSCTGEKDTEENEIYEGDIVEYKIFPGDERIMKGIIEFKSGCFSISNRGLLFGFLSPHRGLKIIGNIHQNPELLEIK